MNLEILDQKSCEGVFSSRDVRYILAIDGFVKVHVVKCEHRDHPKLGELKIEQVKIKDRIYTIEEFEDLPEEYQEPTLYRFLIQTL